MHDINEKPVLPVHLILGASEYAQIKTESNQESDSPVSQWLQPRSQGHFPFCH